MLLERLPPLPTCSFPSKPGRSELGVWTFKDPALFLGKAPVAVGQPSEDPNSKVRTAVALHPAG